MVIQSNCKFIENANTPIVSRMFPNAQGDVLSLQISGANCVCYLEGRNSKQGDWVSLAGIDLSNLQLVAGGFKKAGVYELGIVGIREIRARLESTEGTVSVFGQIISTGEF